MLYCRVSLQKPGSLKGQRMREKNIQLKSPSEHSNLSSEHGKNGS